MHVTGLYLRAWPMDRRLNEQEGYTIKLYTAPPAPVVKLPDGWELVPITPTVEMRHAFHNANEEANDGYHDVCSPDHEWRAMLAAAPEAP